VKKKSSLMTMCEAAVLMQEVVSMLSNPTSQKLRDMKLKVMAQMMDEPDSALRELSFEDRLGIYLAP
jgi:hypothetical protein